MVFIEIKSVYKRTRVVQTHIVQLHNEIKAFTVDNLGTLHLDWRVAHQ